VGIYTVNAEEGRASKRCYHSELDALRANKSNTDAARKVRFLPYGRV